MNRIKNIIYLESGGIIEWGGSSVAAAGGGWLAIILFDHDVVAVAAAMGRAWWAADICG